MTELGSVALIIAASFDGAAAFAHLVCLVFGAPAFRFFGASEQIIKGFEAGKIQPIIITLAITAILCLWAIYALAGAGVIHYLPFLIMPIQLQRLNGSKRIIQIAI